MKFLIRETAKRKKLSLRGIAERMGVTPQALDNFLKSESLTTNTLEKIASAMEVDVHELIGTGDDHSHFYDQSTGDWLGIRRK